MLFARDKSQMCNNLLQFAHVYAWAREHGRSVMSMRFSYKYPYFRISHSSFVSFPLYLCAKWLAALRLLPTASFKYEDCDAAALEQKMLSHRHIVVSGWYARWYDLFLKYRDEICDLFTIDPQYTQRVTEWMTEQESAAETTEKPIRPASTYVAATTPSGSADATTTATRSMPTSSSASSASCQATE